MENINKEQVEKRIRELEGLIEEADVLYEKNQPILTDTEYDELYAELVKLEGDYPELASEDSPTQKIITSKVAGLSEVKHSEPMLSQDKTTTSEGVIKFILRLGKEGYILIQQKLDGLTIVLTYNNGVLEKAVTRGNGLVGEDVTHTISTVKSVPKTIKFKGKLELRGEAIISYEEFKRINKDGKYSNTRNLVSGTVRQLDAKVAKDRNLDVIIFDIVKVEKEFKDDIEQLKFIKGEGFKVVPTKIVKFTKDTYEKSLKTVLKYVETYNEEVRPTLPYMIDGLVLKISSLRKRAELGSTNKFPRWGIAYKFKSLDARTKLEDIILQVGKTGQITPVAVFEKTVIDNVSITKASLHNFPNITKKDIRIGDTILITRANDVIPQVLKSFHELRDGTEKLYQAPKDCPSCKGELIQKGENLYCTNDNCEPIVLGKLSHFVSRNALDIDGVAGKTLEFLIDNKFITKIEDLYNLNKHEESMKAIKGFGEKKVTKLLKGIEDSKGAYLHQVLYGLSIDLIGNTASKEISKIYKDMQSILVDSDKGILYDKLIAVDGFGKLMVESLVKYLGDSKNRELIDYLLSVGFKMESEYANKPKSADDEKLLGKIFVITGSLERKRDEWKKDIEAMGGKVTGSVTKNTSYILTNDTTSSSSKFVKGKQLGIEFLTEQEFKDKFNL